VEGKKLAEWLNNLSGGDNVYGYDNISDKIIVIAKTDGTTVCISLEKAHNSLKTIALGMQTILIDVFEALIEDKPASKCISLEKAHNSLKTMALGMQTILIDVFEALIEDKPASFESKDSTLLNSSSSKNGDVK